MLWTILVNGELIVTDSRLAQFRNNMFPIVVTDFGMMICFMPELLNAEVPMAVIDWGSTMLSMELL
jgi:hypothetical protein